VIGTIIGAIIGGAIIGGLARLALPGKQGISLPLTIIIGILGSLIASFIVYQLGYSNENGGFQFIPFLAGIAVAAGLIVLYGNMAGRKQIR